MEISLLSDPKFISATQDFVCIRLETYESEENQKRIRSLLGGALVNTAFVVYEPSGNKILTRAGRSPYRVFGGSASNNLPVIEGMKKISSRYPEKNQNQAPVSQDFHSFKQALNVAAADQRLLVVVNQPSAATKRTLGFVANHEKVSGRVHIDTLDEGDTGWEASVGTRKGTLLSRTPTQSAVGFFIIQPDAFGQKGRVLKTLPLSTSASKLAAEIDKQIELFAETHTRQNYGNHIRQGRREGIHYENNMPHGEDRDGDGKIDQRPARKR